MFPTGVDTALKEALINDRLFHRASPKPTPSGSAARGPARPSKKQSLPAKPRTPRLKATPPPCWHDVSDAPHDIQSEDDLNRRLKQSEECRDGIFVLFEAFYCGACQPIIKEFKNYAAKYGDRMSFLTLDQDKFPKIASKYGVKMMPFTIYFQNGTRIAHTFGNSKEAFKAFITKYAPAT